MLFVNFSNHPSKFWCSRQRKASLQYGKLIDMPFPQIAADADDAELEMLSQHYVQRISSLDDPKVVTVHIMGEMTFTFMVVEKLKEMGIKCVASTTERKVTYTSDGVKQTEFQFVKFREY